MNTRKRILLLLMVMVMGGYGFAADDTDFQYRGLVRCSWKIAGDWKGSFYEELYLRDDASQLYNYYSDIGASYAGFAKWLDAGVYYRHVRYISGAVWRTEYRPHADATVKWPMGRYALSNRGRFEYRIREKADDIWRFRDILKIVSPLRWTQYKIQPYAAHEIFYDCHTMNFELHESRAGFNCVITKHITASLFYMYSRSRVSSLPKYKHYIGSELCFNF